jgi:hypothetical protein
MSYAKALAALEAYAPQELIAKHYHRAGKCCVVGVLVPSLRELPPTLAQKSVSMLEYHDPTLVERIERLGFDGARLGRMQEWNDLFYGGHNDATARRARYEYMLGRLRAAIAAEAA